MNLEVYEKEQEEKRQFEASRAEREALAEAKRIAFVALMRLPESERPPPPPRTPYIPTPSEYTEEEYRIAYENIPDRHVEWLITKKDRDTTTIMDLYDPGVSQTYREHIIRFRYFGATPLSFEAILELGYQKACKFNEALYYPRPIPPIHKEYNLMIGFKHPKIKGRREYEGIRRRCLLEISPLSSSFSTYFCFRRMATIRCYKHYYAYY